MAKSGRVLVTGSAGRIGRAVVSELTAHGVAVRGFDRHETPGVEEAFVGNLASRTDLDRAVNGCEKVVHLAATPDDDDFLTRLLPANIVGVYNLMEAARLGGVTRMVLASSGQVNWWQRPRGPLPIRPEDPVTPKYWYAAAKVFLEAAGRAFAEGHGLSVIVARLGWCPRTPSHLEEIAGFDWAQDVYLSPADAGRFFHRALVAEGISFAILFATSRPVVRSYFDLGPSRELIGYDPKDQWPQGVENLRGC
jgi:nucleoside-diphosphate-sugar epimerase